MGRASMAWTSLARAGCVSEVASVYVADYSEASTEWIGAGRRTAEFLELVGPGSVPWSRPRVFVWRWRLLLTKLRKSFYR